MKLTRRQDEGPGISMVAMIDILMIMLVFFMVTSTYLNLDMFPLRQEVDADAAPPAATPGGDVLSLRLGGDDRVYHRGRALDLAGLDGLLAAAGATGRVIVIPSPRATTQGLVTVIDAVTQAGVDHLRIVQIAGRP